MEHFSVVLVSDSASSIAGNLVNSSHVGGIAIGVAMVVVNRAIEYKVEAVKCHCKTLLSSKCNL